MCECEDDENDNMKCASVQLCREVGIIMLRLLNPPQSLRTHIYSLVARKATRNSVTTTRAPGLVWVGSSSQQWCCAQLFEPARSGTSGTTTAFAGESAGRIRSE